MIRPESRLQFLEAIKSGAHIRLEIRPNSEHEKRINGPEELKEILAKCQVYRHGTYFPNLSDQEGGLDLKPSYIEGFYESRRANHMFRLFESGQFVNLASLDEDETEFNKALRESLEISDALKNQLDGYISVMSMAYRIALYTTFLAKLAKVVLSEDGWVFKVSIVNPGVRALSMAHSTRELWSLYKIDQTVEVSNVFSTEIILGSPNSIAQDMLANFLQAFNFKTTDDVIRGMIDEVALR